MGKHHSKFIGKLEVAQKKATRAVLGERYNDPSSPLFKKVNILRLNDMFEHETRHIIIILYSSNVMYSKTCLQGTPQYPRESVPTWQVSLRHRFLNMGQIGHGSEKVSQGVPSSQCPLKTSFTVYILYIYRLYIYKFFFLNAFALTA